MPIIKYTLDNGNIPSGITDGGHFYNRSDNTLIGIGTGGGTEITKAELIARVQAYESPDKRIPHFAHTWGFIDGGIGGEIDMSTIRERTDDEWVTLINEWCTQRGIS
tara:strand:- start:51 stop:371 length:321 start_codon:yes stop_codon:yes gene_type:complete